MRLVTLPHSRLYLPLCRFIHAWCVLHCLERVKGQGQIDLHRIQQCKQCLVQKFRLAGENSWLVIWYKAHVSPANGEELQNHSGCIETI